MNEMKMRENETKVCKRILDKELERFKKKSLYEKRKYLAFEIPWLISRANNKEDEAKVPTIEEERLVYKNLKNPFFYKETLSKPLNVESTYDLLNELTRQNLLIMMQDLWEMKVGRGIYYKIPEKKATYYVYAMHTTGEWHPAEGGSTLSHHRVAWVREFQTFKKALRFIRKEIKGTDFDELEMMLEGYGRVRTSHYISTDKQQFGVCSGYDADSYDVYLSRKKPYSHGYDWDGNRMY